MLCFSMYMVYERTAPRDALHGFGRYWALHVVVPVIELRQDGRHALRSDDGGLRTRSMA